MKSRILRWACLFVLGAALCGMPGGPAAASAGTDELEEEHSLSTEFETPHTDWAQPYAGGKLRALFFADIGYCGTLPREIVELKQRFDLDAAAVYWARIIDSTQEHWHGDAAGIARMHRLLGQSWDCFVFLNMAPDRLPPEEQLRLLTQVTEGAGLVLVGPDDARVLRPARKLPLPEFLQAGVPLLQLPFVQASYAKADAGTQPPAASDVAGRMLSAHQVKAGRGVHLPARPNIDYYPGWEVEYDYWQSMVGRAILWAAGREPKATLSVVPALPSFDRSTLPGRHAICLSWGGLDPAARPAVRLRLRGCDGSTRTLPACRPTSANGQLLLDVPLLPAGGYAVDAIAKGSAGVIAWASGGFQVASQRSIKEVALDQPYSEIGGRLTGHVTVDGAPVLKGERIRVDALDRHGRVLMRQEAPPAGHAVSFTFPVTAWLPMLLRVEATLLSGGTPVSRAYAWFNVTRRNRDQFNFLIWDVPSGTLGPYGEESLVRQGVTLHLNMGSPPRYVQAYDVAWVPYTTRIQAPLDANGFMKPSCWNDEAAITKEIEAIVTPHQAGRQSGVFVYSLGDEGVTRGACLCPNCLAAYRSHLRGEYGTIAALNESWGTQYTSFDQIANEPPADNDGAAWKTAGNYPRWFDRQAFHSANFVGLCKRYVDAFARTDPQARVGFEGAGTFDAGDDYDGIVRTNGFWSPYPDMGDEVIRSIAPKGFPRSNWMGYTKDADSLVSKYWRMITRGCDSVWYWRWDGVARFHGWLAPHLGPYSAVKEIVRDTQVVRDGLGTLLIKSQMQHDGIAFVYSMPSAYATRVEKGPAYGSYMAAHTAWSRLLREMGLQYRYVTDRMLRQGEFDPKEFKVVVLARTEAMTTGEAALLRRFVENGGTLIADVRPALFDGHCKPLKQGALDDVFGIKRTAGNVEPARGEAVIGDDENAERIPNALCDPAVALDGGKAAGKLGETPVLIWHPFGKGAALLLNLTAPSVPGLSAADAPLGLASPLGQVLREAGVSAQVRVLNAKGKPERNLEVVRWKNGSSTLVALFRENGARSRAKVVLPKPAYVYDLRARKALGRVSSFALDILPCRATFLAVSPAPAAPATLALPPKPLKPGQVGELVLRSGAAAGLRAVLLTARTPDGKVSDWLRRVVMVPPAGAKVPLPVALNDPAGKWELQARELYTGAVTKATFTVAR